MTRDEAGARGDPHRCPPTVRDGAVGETPHAVANGAASITCDLKRLNTIDGEIASGALPAGHYTGVRLVVQSASMYLDNPSDAVCGASLRPPSGRMTAIAIANPEIALSRSFDMTAGSDQVMRLALNTGQSIRNSDGTFTFTPVVTVLSVN